MQEQFEQEEPLEDAEAPEAEEQEPAPQWAPDDEQEARLFGWKPREEWQGDVPPTFVDDPGEFLEKRVRGSRIFKTMQEQNEALRRDLEADKQRAMEQQKAAYQARLQHIQQEQRKAAESADTEAFDRLEEERQRLQAGPPVPQDQPKPAPAQSVDDLTDPWVRSYAQSAPGQWMQNPEALQEAWNIIQSASENDLPLNASPARQVRYAYEQMQVLRPDLIQQEQPKPQRQQSRVDGGGLGQPGKSPFSKLPQQAKDAFRAQVSKGIFSDTKEDREFYANEYLSL